VVALTFDDGPHPVFTPQILDILTAKDVKATFFLVGREAERHPDLVRRIVAEGHIIGNHTWNHAHLQGLSEERFSFEIDHTTEVLEAISGQDVVCTRPPYGDAKPDTVERLAAHGQASVVWSADSRDFDKPGPGPIVDHSLEGLRPGSIVLLHDGGPGAASDPPGGARRPRPRPRGEAHPRPDLRHEVDTLTGPSGRSQAGI
jgi:peptidoglycan/xylan/chitin deacetylase (PgdA/CDA1 family)